MVLKEKIPNSYIFVDGSGVGDVGADVMREREALAQDGMVTVNIILDRMSGRLMQDPEIRSKGFIAADDRRRSDEPGPQTHCRNCSAFQRQLTQDVERAVRDLLYAETHRKPTVFVSVSKV